MGTNTGVYMGALETKLDGIPFLDKPELVRKYLAPSLSTPKGRMEHPRAGLQSTQNKKNKENEEKVKDLPCTRFSQR